MEKLFRENKTSPLLKTPEKDFHFNKKTFLHIHLETENCTFLHSWIFSGVAISTFFRRGRGRFQPNCGHKAAWLKLNLRLSSTPSVAAAAGT